MPSRRCIDASQIEAGNEWDLVTKRGWPKNPRTDFCKWDIFQQAMSAMFDSWRVYIQGKHTIELFESELNHSSPKVYTTATFQGRTFCEASQVETCHPWVHPTPNVSNSTFGALKVPNISQIWIQNTFPKWMMCFSYWEHKPTITLNKPRKMKCPLRKR